MRLDFGKYRGRELSEIPEDYLMWLWASSKDLADAIEAELEARQREKLAKLNVAEQIIEAGYRVLALKRHPDRGGNHEDMLELNATVEKLRRVIGSSEAVRRCAD